MRTEVDIGLTCAGKEEWLVEGEEDGVLKILKRCLREVCRETGVDGTGGGGNGPLGGGNRGPEGILDIEGICLVLDE